MRDTLGKDVAEDVSNSGLNILGDSVIDVLVGVGNALGVEARLVTAKLALVLAAVDLPSSDGLALAGSLVIEVVGS